MRSPHTIRTLAARAHRDAAPLCTATLTASPSSNVMGSIDSNHHHHHCAVRCFATKKFQKNKGGAGSASKSDSASSSSPYGSFSDADFAAARSKDLDLILAALNAPSRHEPPISDEEKARRHEIGRNYVIGRFKQHNAIHHDLACKIQMKKHAVNMLPKQSKLKEEAMKIDDQGPPPWRHLAAWTPPIPGYDPADFLEKEEE